MKKLLRVSYFVFAIVLFTSLFTSCKKDEIVEPTPEVTTNPTPSDLTPSTNAAKVIALQSGGAMTMDSTDFCGCFAIFDEVDWDGSDDEIIVALEAILAGLTEQELEELFTPVCNADGEIFENACIALCNGVTDFEACDDSDGDYDDWTECFSFVYPVTVVLPGVANLDANSNEELFSAVDAWYDENPNSDEDPTLVYPVNVLLETDGSSITITNDDELEGLFDICSEHFDAACFTFNWPISLQFPDSSIVTVNSLEEGENAVDTWYEAHPNEEEEVELVLPFDVTMQNGTVQTISNEEELNALIDECGSDIGGCFIVDDAPNALAQLTTKRKEVANAQ